MIFKVVRTDTDNNYKIKLPFGVFTIGRSHFKIEEDLRISRNHAQLEVTADTLTLKSLHKNPCFYIKEGKEIHVLKQDCSVELTHGNKFGLLPEVFWYEVQQLPDEDSNESDKDETVLVPNGTSTDNEVRTSISEDNDPQSNQHTDTAPNKTDINGISPQVPLVDNAVTPTKRNNTSMDTSPVDVKKVKTEPVDSSIVKTEPMDTSNVQVEPTVQNADVTSGNATVKVEPTESSNARVDPNTGNAASPSDVQPGTSNNDQSGDNAAPTSPVKPTVRLRERCFYGANCYRRNPQHREDFCHPNDSDWGSGEQTACPYGSGCGRRDPRHWRLHSHPAGAAPPAPRPHPPGKQRKRRQRRVSLSDEDSPVDNLIVVGKRSRKTVNRQSWGDSESDEEDPYGTDESDEWQPPSDVPDSGDYSQDF